MKKITFTKMVGAGNDFILIDMNLNENFKPANEVIRRICDRRFGIGADGVLIIKDSTNFDFSMEYYNADGTTGALCGNGARCIIKYAQKTNRTINKSVVFEFQGKKFSGQLLENELVAFYLNEPKEIRNDMTIFVDDRNIPVNFVDVDTPHVVIDIDDLKKVYAENIIIDNAPVESLGKKIRYAKEYFINGTNVNFVQFDKSSVRIRTYERGVESETLSCGTGSVSAALVLNIRYNLQPPIKLLTRSEEILTVNFRKEGNKFKSLSLTGKAKVVFNGEIFI